MSNKIKLEKQNSKSGYWISPSYEIRHTIPVNKKLESKKNEEVADALLDEFVHSDKELKKIFKQKLLLWLSDTDESTLDTIETEKIRDLIYEMF